MNGCSPITKDEYVLTLEALQGPNQERDRCFFILGMATGFRCSEILSVRRGDVLGTDGRIKDELQVAKCHMKGERDPRKVDLHDTAKDALRVWLRKMENNGIESKDAFLFYGEGRTSLKPMTRQHAWYILKKAWESCGMGGRKSLATHSMRKSYLNKIYKRTGNDLIATKEAAGHASVATTEKYLGVNRAKIKKATTEGDIV